jgi:glycosyltransferase involved in cell wall biosynthesis
MYNCADCVINISNNEGFGLGTLEAIFAGTPIVVNMTGGLQFQIGDWWCDQRTSPTRRS